MPHLSCAQLHSCAAAIVAHKLIAAHVSGTSWLTLLHALFLPFLSSPRAEAGKVELDGATYAGFDLPFSITQLVWIEAILVGGAEIYRNTELDPERRLYPGERTGQGH